jgi:hypothetical protein
VTPDKPIAAQAIKAVTPTASLTEADARGASANLIGILY